ncbi:MAG: hypothetical protein HC834_10005, partial [Rhodospirillales bacterium]|nr:hypothetical protein [Rhodospirillales bacterium]
MLLDCGHVVCGQGARSGFGERLGEETIEVLAVVGFESAFPVGTEAVEQERQGGADGVEALAHVGGRKTRFRHFDGRFAGGDQLDVRRQALVELVGALVGRELGIQWPRSVGGDASRAWRGQAGRGVG